MQATPARPRPIRAGTLVLCRDSRCRDLHPLWAGSRPGVWLFTCPATGSEYLAVLDGRPLPSVVLVGTED